MEARHDIGSVEGDGIVVSYNSRSVCKGLLALINDLYRFLYDFGLFPLVNL